jgi:transcriptional regulator with XRE-family HTH domain
VRVRNQLLRAARERTPPRQVPGEWLSRREVAEAVNMWIYENTEKTTTLDANYLAKLERGVVRWPSARYRAGLRAVLGVATDLKVPTRPLFVRARAIRNQAFALLVGHQRPDQSRDLYVAAGWALTLLAWISTDLGRPDAANTHARAAWVCANNADHHGLRVWIRATQHTAAFWEHHFLDAARYAEDGLRYATTGSAETFLASAHALDLAKAGQGDNARAALARARDATESVEQTCDELADRSPARRNERVVFGRTCISRSVSPPTRWPRRIVRWSPSSGHRPSGATSAASGWPVFSRYVLICRWASSTAR